MTPRRITDANQKALCPTAPTHSIGTIICLNHKLHIIGVTVKNHIKSVPCHEGGVYDSKFRAIKDCVPCARNAGEASAAKIQPNTVIQPCRRPKKRGQIGANCADHLY